MDILVFVKQVPDDSVEIHLDGAGVPAVKDVEKITNAFDTYALELAARYTEANGGEVTRCSYRYRRLHQHDEKPAGSRRKESIFI